MTSISHLPKKRSSIQAQVVRHPLISFVTLAYIITWAVWPLNERIDLGTVNGFGIISLIGPALAAMIVSAASKPEHSEVPAAKQWRLFGILSVLVLLVIGVVRLWYATGLVTAPGISEVPVAYPSVLALLTDMLAAIVVAFVLSGVYSTRRGVRGLLHTLDPRATPARWYWWVLAVGLYPAVIVLGNIISTIVGLPIPSPTTNGAWPWLILNVIIMIPYFVFGGGGLEEVGWRGFALRKLQERYTPLRSSLILAVVWTFWHWPFLKAGPLDMLVYGLLVVVPLAVLFTAVYNWVGGSLPIVILLHVSINLTDQTLAASSLATGLWLLLVFVITLWMWRSPQVFSFRTGNANGKGTLVHV